MNKDSTESQKALRDELDRKTKELEVTRQELEKFTYSVSHDLRAPLRAIEGFSKILLEDYNDKLDDDGKRYLNILDASSRKMTRLLDDLLQLSRLGRQEMRPSRLNMEELVRSVWQELQSKQTGRKIEFHLGHLPEADGDASLLKIIWTHLISNALKFSTPRETAVIEITGKLETDRIVYCIKDNGVGFHMNAAGKLFGAFQRLHTEEEFSGSGMGLAIVQRLVRRHSGEVWADAKKGEGASFCFSLPAREGNK